MNVIIRFEGEQGSGKTELLKLFLGALIDNGFQLAPDPNEHSITVSYPLVTIKALKAVGKL